MGFFKYFGSDEEVLARALELAAAITVKSLAAIPVRKLTSNVLEGLKWREAYLPSQRATAALTTAGEGQERVSAFRNGAEVGRPDR